MRALASDSESDAVNTGRLRTADYLDGHATRIFWFGTLVEADVKLFGLTYRLDPPVRAQLLGRGIPQIAGRAANAKYEASEVAETCRFSRTVPSRRAHRVKIQECNLKQTYPYASVATKSWRVSYGSG